MILYSIEFVSTINADDNIALEAKAGIADIEAFLAEAALATA